MSRIFLQFNSLAICSEKHNSIHWLINLLSIFMYAIGMEDKAHEI